jgi:hypothetical protein
LVESAERASEIIKTVKSVYLHKLVQTIRVGDLKDDNPLSLRQNQVLPWIKSWISPLSSKLDKTVQQALDKTLFNVANDSSVVEIVLSKIRCLQEDITPYEIRDRLRLLLLDMCLISSSEIFEDDWMIRIVPFPVEEFVQSSIFDSKSICEALIDVMQTNVLVRGLQIVSEVFHVPTKIDVELASGGLGKKEYRKIGCVGSDLIAMAYRVDDPSKLWTNDIHETAQFLGIESATALNSAELQRVLSFDSTYIDPRHTLLLAETMGRSGSIAALNRHKMEELGSSLLSRASFEQTRRVIEDAAFFYRSDPLSGSLERQIVGLPLRVGTGIVALLEEKAQHETTVIAPLHKEKPWIASHVIAALRTEEGGVGIAPLQMEYSPHVSYLNSALQQESLALQPLMDLWAAELSNQETFLTIKYNCNAKTFAQSLERVSSYMGWEDERALEWQQTTQVHYDEIMTTIDAVDAGKTGKTVKIHFKTKTLQSQKIQAMPLVAEVLAYFPQPVVPSSVLPSLVSLRQKRVFLKCGWRIVFKKSWSAQTYMEANAKMLSEPPSFSISVAAISAEASYNQVIKVQDVLLQKVWDIASK